VEATPHQGTILVVDDDDGVRALLKKHLTAAGHSVLLAESAAAAERLLMKDPDLMIVDADLGGTSGVEFVSTLICDPAMPWVPVIFMTGRAKAESRAATLGSACLVKPFLAPRLLELVERVLRSQARANAAAAYSLNAA